MVQNWETPELIVLVQGRNDEQVLLSGCSGHGGNGPGNSNGACTSNEGGRCHPCGESLSG
jgi:hypothetical protein